MRRTILTISLLLSFVISFPLIAQNSTQNINGRIIESGTELPIVGAIVVLKSKEGKNLCFSTSNSFGIFNLKLKRKIEKGDSLHISMLGYKGKIVIPKLTTATMDIILEIDALTLKETIIKAPKVALKGDTVKYNVKSFADIQDKSIGDVLKKMPGIEVLKGGQITYNGEAINNFYIEGNDMLGGKYGLATENISAKDVKSVEVLENHQATKALKDIVPSERAAINLRLTEEAKAKWIWRGELNMGYSNKILIEGELFNMRIAKGSQSVSSLKMNNIGKNYRSEITNFFQNNQSSKYDLKDLIAVGVSNAPLEEKRVRFNNSTIFSTTNSWSLKKDYTIDAQLSYLFDHLESSNRSQTSYFLPDSTTIVNESDESFSRKHNLSSNVTIKANKDDYYLFDKLSVDAQWREASSLMKGSFPNRESAKTPYIDLHNYLQYIKKVKKSTFNIYSNNQFIHKDHSLIIERMDGTNDIQKESINNSLFFTKTETSYSYKSLSGIVFSVNGGFEGVIRRMESSLFDNNLHLGYLRPYVNPFLTYKNRKLEISISSPMSYDYYWCKRAETGKYLLNDHSFNIAPRLNFRIMFTSKFEMFIGGNISKSKLNLGEMYEGYILRNYRHMSFGNFNTEKGLIANTFLRVSFRDPVNSFFINGEFGWLWNGLKEINSQYFLGNYIVSGLIPRPNNISSWNTKISSSKGIYSINGKVSLDASYNRATMESLQNEILSPYLSEVYNVEIGFNGRFARWLSTEYQIEYSHSILTLNHKNPNAVKNHKNQFDHNLKFIINPFRKLNIKVICEHYFTELNETHNKNMFLLDLMTEYYLNSKIRLSISAKNILNSKNYSYSIFSGLSSYSAAYQIRPLNILAGLYISF